MVPGQITWLIAVPVALAARAIDVASAVGLTVVVRAGHIPFAVEDGEIVLAVEGLYLDDDGLPDRGGLEVHRSIAEEALTTEGVPFRGLGSEHTSVMPEGWVPIPMWWRILIDGDPTNHLIQSDDEQRALQQARETPPRPGTSPERISIERRVYPDPFDELIPKEKPRE